MNPRAARPSPILRLAHSHDPLVDASQRSAASSGDVTFPQHAVSARPVSVLPRADSVPGGAAYEPSWGGRRALIFVSQGRCRIQSRTGRDITRMFPEIAAVAVQHVSSGVVLDGELVRSDGHNTYIASDLLAGAGMDMRASPFRVRRQALTMMLDGTPEPLQITPLTRDRREARAWLTAGEEGHRSFAGVVAKGLSTPYTADQAGWEQVRHGRENTPLGVVVPAAST